HRGSARARRGRQGGRSGTEVRGLGSHAVQLEGQVWRAGCLRGQAAEGAGRGESQAEEAPRRVNARQCRAEGASLKKMVGPVAKRKAVAHLRIVLEMDERRACTLVASDRTMIRLRPRR